MRLRAVVAAVACTVFAVLLSVPGPVDASVGTGAVRVDGLERLGTVAASDEPGPPQGRPAKERDRGRVLVGLEHPAGRAAAQAEVATLGGELIGSVGDGYSEAYLPQQSVAALQQRPGVRVVGEVQPVTPEAAIGFAGTHGGLAIDKVKAAAWHDAGITGAGVKVGIIDFFDGGTWSAAQAVGEVPAPADSFCLFGGSSCSVGQAGLNSEHGVAVAEVVHDVAPDAALYRVTVGTATDLQWAIMWMSQQGVTIVVRSLTTPYDSPGDGTGPHNQAADYAVSTGMTWFNAAGNSAGSTGKGTYWRGSWSDPDADNILNFNGGVERLPFSCGFSNGFRWSDWGPNRTDYDVYVYDNAGDPVPQYGSEGDQSSGEEPIEAVGCDGPSDTDYLEVRRYTTGSGSAGDVLEVQFNNGFITNSSNPYSAAIPIADSANSGVLAVGAIDYYLSSAVAYYSSRGPTNDGRIKPSLTAVAGMSSKTYGTFNGTSAATPAAAAAAALLRQAYPSDSATGLATRLITTATVDRGTSGPDNDYGAGEVQLPAPPVTQSLPGAPAAPTVKPSYATLTASWTPPATAGSTPVTGYQVQFRKVGASSWSVAPAAAVDVGQRRAVLNGLENWVDYQVRVAAINSAGRGPFSAATTAQPSFDVYTTPGTHLINGRQWRTNCEPYSSTADRCWTYIVATQTKRTSTGYVTTTDWAFNNLTYVDPSPEAWVSNPLAKPGQFVSGGRSWQVTCSPNVSSGPRTCRAYVWAKVISRQASSSGYTYSEYYTWVFNNVVKLG